MHRNRGIRYEVEKLTYWDIAQNVQNEMGVLVVSVVAPACTSVISSM